MQSGVNVRGDGVRVEAVGKHGARGLEGERALAVADVEQHAAFARLQHRPFHRALRGGGRIGERPERMGENVARTQPGEHLLVARRRMVDMRHQRHADLVCDLKRDLERHDTRRARRMEADPDLDADDEIAVRVRHVSGVDRIYQPELLALAYHDPIREAEDAGMRDMQVGENADLARLDHVLAEAREIARARRCRCRPPW